MKVRPSKNYHTPKGLDSRPQALRERRVLKRRLAEPEPSQRKSAHPPLGALDSNEGKSYKHTSQYQLSQKLNLKISSASFEACSLWGGLDLLWLYHANV